MLVSLTNTVSHWSLSVIIQETLVFWYMFVFRCTADRRRARGVEPGEFSPPGVWEHPGRPAVLQRGWPGDQRCKEKRRDTAWRGILSGNLWIHPVMPNMAAVPSLTPKPYERVMMSDWCKRSFTTASAVWEHFYSSLFLAYCNHITLEADFSHISVLCMQGSLRSKLWPFPALLQ